MTTSTNTGTSTIGRTMAQSLFVSRTLAPLVSWVGTSEGEVPVSGAERAQVLAIRDTFTAAGYRGVTAAFADLLAMCPATDDAWAKWNDRAAIRAELAWMQTRLERREVDGVEYVPDALPTVPVSLVKSDAALAAWERGEPVAALPACGITGCNIPECNAQPSAVPVVETVENDAAAVAAARIAELETALRTAQSQQWQAVAALDQFKIDIAEMGERYAEENNFCSVYDQFIAEAGLVRPEREPICIDARVTITLSLSAVYNREMSGDRSEHEERATDSSFVRDSLRISSIRNALQGISILDDDWTDESVSFDFEVDDVELA